jgi:hypothetical protein
MLRALEQVRRMRGGAQSQLMRCADGKYYVVKFKNNPQGIRTLANELFAGRLAKLIGLPTPIVAVIGVQEGLIRYTDDLVIQLGCGREKCEAGSQSGSQYAGSPATGRTWDLLPDSLFAGVSNIPDFWGMFVFDKWTCNTDGRQVVYVGEAPAPGYRVVMIDNGFCFNGGEWNFPDAPLRSFYGKSSVYQNIHGIQSFEPWLTRIEAMTKRSLRDCSRDIPVEWLDFHAAEFEEMIEQLWRRRERVRELIIAAVRVSPHIFPGWLSCANKQSSEERPPQQPQTSYGA